MTESLVFSVWHNSPLQRCFCKRQRCEPNERKKFENVMAYVIKNLFLGVGRGVGGGGGNSFISNCIEKSTQ